jgi:hypothetical protein
MSRRGGIIQVKVDGVLYDAKGDFEYNLGRPVREAIIGVDTVHGFKETPQVAFIEGEVTDRGDLDLNALVTLTGATVTLTLASGKVIALSEAWYAGEGTGNTGEGNIGVRFEARVGEEIRA